MTTRIDLGDHFYLWMPGLTPGKIVVISSHGGVLNSTFTMPPGTTFKFYSLPTTSAQGSLDKTLYDDTIRDTQAHNPKFPGGNQTDDYVLEKFQGRHGGDSESYADVRKWVADNNISVLTVRNRTSWFVKKDEHLRYLSAAVLAIQTRFPEVKEFRCLFCRVEVAPAWRNALTGERVV